MKVSIEDENNFIVFLNNKKFDFEEKEELEEQFRSIFKQIKQRYKFDVSGYYEISVYKDNLYGTILSIEKEELEYFNYFDNQIEMRIIISPYETFIYKLQDNDLNISLNNCNVYLYLGNIYLKPNKKIKNIEFAKLLEYTTVIYGEDADIILKYSKKI